MGSGWSVTPKVVLRVLVDLRVPMVDLRLFSANGGFMVSAKQGVGPGCICLRYKGARLAMGGARGYTVPVYRATMQCTGTRCTFRSQKLLTRLHWLLWGDVGLHPLEGIKI